MTEEIITKKCTQCQVEKVGSKFSKCSASKDGLQTVCKACTAIYTKQYRFDNKEVIVERKRKYRLANKEAIAKHNKQYRLANGEALLKQKKQYYFDNKETIAEGMKQYQLENKEAIAKQSKKYYIKNKKAIARRGEQYRFQYKDVIKKRKKKYNQNNKITIAKKTKEYSRTEQGKAAKMKAHYKRRALKYSVPYGIFSRCDIFERDGYVCQLCGCKTRPDFKNQYHPKRPELDHIVPLSKGGSHTKANCQCLCHQCNITKHHTGTGDQLRLFG